MILNNYFVYKGQIEGHEHGTSTTYNFVNLGLKDISGNVYLFEAQGPVADVSANWASKIRLSAYIGTGTTEPSADDYSLENDITNNITDYSVTFNTSAESGKVITVATITGVNATGNDIVISEVGVAKEIYGKVNGAVSTGSAKILFIRHILETHKTVASGEGFSLTFEWVEA